MAKKYPGEVTLVPIGPLTNIAMALKLEPELPKLTKDIVIMGGAAQVPGNVTPVAEANIWNDPHAADIVFSADWRLKMIGLDVTYAVSYPQAYLSKLGEVNPSMGALFKRQRNSTPSFTQKSSRKLMKRFVIFMTPWR